MSLFPGPQESTFWFDFESLTDNNLWKDQGPHSLHATPQAGFSSPAYGLSRTTRGKGYVTFTGAANCYATLPLRFYDVAPTGECTWVAMMERMTINAGGFSRLFSCELIAATYKGIAFGPVLSVDPGRTYAVQLENTAAYEYTQTPAGCIGFSPTSVVVQTVEAAPKSWINRVGLTTTWGGVGFGTTVYSAVTTPCLGQIPAGGSGFLGRCSFLALFPFPFSNQQAQAMSDWLRNMV